MYDIRIINPLRLFSLGLKPSGENNLRLVDNSGYPPHNIYIHYKKDKFKFIMT